MSQYLGDISAYALAVSQGYTGTEEEYAELMASYATVGQTAVTAAQTATTKASEAATSATTATNKASEATTAATTATTKAGEASTSASTATSAKDTAVSASQTATTKATEATTAAATATSAATTATTAKDDAVSAKTAAQTAQTGAETAAASVQASAAQIQTNADDISELKEDLTSIGNDAFIYKKSGAIPSYYFDTDSNQSYLSQEYLEQKIASIPNGKHCIFYTDVHWATNRKNSTALIEYIRKRTGIKTVICGGDILNLDDSKYTASKNMAAYVNEMASAIGGNLLIAMGDHDNNTANYSGDSINDVMLPFSVIEKWFMTPIASKAQRQSVEDLDTLFSSIAGITADDKNELIAYMRTHFYLDDTKQKIRYVVLTSGITNDGVINTYFGINATTELSLQFDWLYETLLSVPNGYDVVIVSHNTIDVYNATPDFISTATTRLHRIASALKGKGRYTVTIGGGNATFQSLFGGSKTFDFANANSVNNVIILGGDTHINIDCVFGQGDGSYALRKYNDATIGNNDVLTITTQTDNYAQHNQYIANDSMGESSRMSKDSISEQAVDVVTIGSNNLITFTRFGAGIDRVFDMSAS